MKSSAAFDFGSYMVDYTQFDAFFTKSVELKNRCEQSSRETFFFFFVFQLGCFEKNAEFIGKIWQLV